MTIGWGAIALLSAAGTWAARGYALRRALIDEPGERRSHREATPRGGGVGPVVAVLVALATLVYRGGLQVHAAAWTAAGLVAVAGIGWWDDHRPLPAARRLLVHVLAGIALMNAGGFLPEAPFHAVLTVVVTAVLVNVWNFMDGINGIATLQAIVVAAVAVILQHGLGYGMPLALAAACIGFLPFNFPRARIFLGDVGSGSLGFLLAAVVILPSSTDLRFSVLLMFPLGIFVIDSGLTLLRRMLRGERWWTPHTQHLYQVAARRFGHTAVALAYAAVAAVGGVASAALKTANLPLIFGSLALWYTALALSWTLLQHLAAGRGASTEKDR